MIKKIICILVLVCLASSLFALDFSQAKPYSEEEFPKIALDLRRAEVIFFGGIPLFYPAVNLAMGALGKSTDFATTIGISCAISAAIAVADYVIGIVQN